jgi:hypothetical protein
MPSEQVSTVALTSGKIACALVIALIVATLAYVATTAISQYGNIGV